MSKKKKKPSEHAEYFREVKTIEDRYLYKSVDMAKYVLARMNEQNICLSKSKMQMVMYVTYGFYIATEEKRLLNEMPKALPLGPVFPTVMNKTQDWELYDVDRAWLEDDIRLKLESDHILNDLLDYIIDAFAIWTAKGITEWACTGDSPWLRATKREGFRWGQYISDYDIIEFFKAKLAQEHPSE